ncbi:hypothetical protein [Rhizobium sp. Leaf383]|uniref:hypothetical protein n=1 Tax=Rhizobium sp. Leaf383 TaxID=1736357 RepID=UPI000715185B|nr:hypothetical protein [Rhizobium sp. Leaf383]KQS84845.1 hypothetical protein ASG58_20345 [Rhizobium sp. Leaf383]
MHDTAIEMEMDGSEISAASAAFLAGLLDEETVPGKRGPKVTVNVASMTREQRLAHNAELRRARYARKTDMKASGSLPIDEQTARDALADAALMILASGTPGAEAIMTYLEKVYSDKGGAPLSIHAKARSGKLRPKLIAFAAKAM